MGYPEDEETEENCWSGAYVSKVNPRHFGNFLGPIVLDVCLYITGFLEKLRQLGIFSSILFSIGYCCQELLPDNKTIHVEVYFKTCFCVSHVWTTAMSTMITTEDEARA